MTNLPCTLLLTVIGVSNLSMKIFKKTTFKKLFEALSSDIVEQHNIRIVVY